MRGRLVELIIFIGAVWLIFFLTKDRTSEKNPTRGENLKTGNFIPGGFDTHSRTGNSRPGGRKDAENLNTGNFIPGGFNNYSRTGNSRAGGRKDTNETLIQRALSAKKVVTFSYVDQEGEVTYRTVEPIRLEKRHANQILCLIAYCHLRGAERTFVLHRMRNLKIA